MQLSVNRRRMYGGKGSSEVIDLSMVDNAGNARASMTTANCYLVHTAGNYKIPLVYGNAIKNGSRNTTAYYPGTVTNGLSRFINHAGTGITGPWITKSSSNTGVDKGMGYTAASAQLLWQTYQSSISAVSADGDYLYFSVNHPAGSALIAVKDSNGIIMWSWHIWMTSETLANAKPISTGSRIYKIAPVTLGQFGYSGLHYQWGRKDPMPTLGNDNFSSLYGISNLTIDGITYKSTVTSIADGIKNPLYFYYNSNTSGPFDTTYFNLWDAKNSSTGNVSTATKKTIYDPCPPGFCVPTDNLYNYLATDSSLVWSNTLSSLAWGSNNSTYRLHADGYRQYTNGKLVNKKTSGSYWSAIPSVNTSSNGFQFNSSTKTAISSYRSVGMSILPVVE